MSTEFEWRFGDELPEAKGPDEQAGRRAWRVWLTWLLTILVAAGGAFVWWRGRQRNLAEAEAAVEQVARLELRALAEGDGELYASLQDPVDRSWREAQAAYLQTGGLPLPLHDPSIPVTTTVESARIVGERAEVTIRHAAALPNGAEALFRAIRFYRYTSDGRWLHTKTPPDFGGETVKFIADNVRVTVYGNDPISIEPVASQLGNVPDRFCRLVSCEKFSRLSPDFEEAKSMANLIGLDTSVSLNLDANLEGGAEPDDAVLPATVLLGAPANEAAQTAWHRALGHFLVDYLITTEIGPTKTRDEQRGDLVEERLRAWLKAKLGVSAPFSPDLEPLRGAFVDEVWLSVWRLWIVQPDSPQRDIAAAEIDLLLAFLEEEYGAAAVAGLLQRLPEADRIEELLASIEGRGWSAMEDRFLGYARRRLAASSDGLSFFTRYDFLLTCEQRDLLVNVVDIWGHRLDESEPDLLWTGATDEALEPASWSPDGTLLLARATSPDGTRWCALEAGTDRVECGVPIPEDAHVELTYGFGRSGWSPDGHRLGYQLPGLESGGATVRSGIVDLTSGEAITLPGYFVGWSPDGSRVLYGVSPGSESDRRWFAGTNVTEFYVAKADGSDALKIAEGYAAAWSPADESIVYVSADRALMAYDPTNGERAEWLDPDTFRGALGFSETPAAAERASFHLAWAPDGEWLAVGASQGGKDPSEWAMEPGQGSEDHGAASSVILARGGEHRLLTRHGGQILILAWAPDGRRLHAVVFRAGWLWTSLIERDGSVALREVPHFLVWSRDGRFAGLAPLGYSRMGLEILDVNTGERWGIDVPGDCRPPLWNPLGPGIDPTAVP